MTDGPGRGRYDWFTVFGVELEYMIVDAASLEVRSISDDVLRPPAGGVPGDVVRGDVTWSNELVMHVIELKTTEPTSSLRDWDLRFQDEIQQVERRLEEHHCCLLPSGMHPWMKPTAMRLWPYEHQHVYQAFDRLFDCRSHGWANLQSVHLNLPFADDRQFRALHAAIRLVLPLLPGLAASSPYCEGAFAGNLDHRLHVYRTNARAVASICGDVIPETVRSEAEYQEKILQPMYRDVASLDPEGVLQDEFLNARGAIARFSRGSIEIRLLDVAECPLVDLAICQLVTAVLASLCHEQWCSLDELEAVPTPSLVELLVATIGQAEEVRIRDRAVLRVLGWPHERFPSVQELWSYLAELLATGDPGDRFHAALNKVLADGPLARRLLRVAGPEPRPGQLLELYQELSRCLRENRMFL